jgi:4-diphosphocytidyl-2-C-methyl-D-erythritol kinase
MTDVMRVTAPCKINLHLRVLQRRADGFHDIESVFQLISLADELSVSMTGDGLSCEVVSPLMALPRENTITAAVDAFRARTGVRRGVRIEVQKLVPSGAGLGGGSSDAASTLLALNRMFGTDLPVQELAAMAAKVGSDVPFFLYGGAAVVEGRGEVITPIASRDDLYGVLVWPGVPSPTGAAYGLVDRAHEAGVDCGIEWPTVGELEKMYRTPVSEWKFRNSFTSPVESAYPVIREARMALRDCGAVYAEMSGSGSSVFGLFEDETAAEAAQKTLSARWGKVCQFLLLASSPMR